MIKNWRGTAALGLCAAGLAGCQSLSSVRLKGLSFNEKNPYAGVWDFAAQPSSVPAVPGCEAQWGPFNLPVSVASDGAFDAADAKGTVSSGGSVSISEAAPAKDSCGGGSGSGQCASADSCRGTFNGNDGASSSWLMTRRSAPAAQP
ncbi:MAG TPA: hypothetical protein VNH15_05725 [Elusimicrobiota bacterium]|jgi:hypothetical protein|nr:hypothetical protein [Elusimicrobiota bacterium]